jgi:hypothetical protein
MTDSDRSLLYDEDDQSIPLLRPFSTHRAAEIGSEAARQVARLHGGKSIIREVLVFRHKPKTKLLIETHRPLIAQET